MQKKIAIFVDHKIRDLAGMVYLKLLLEEYGYEVLVTYIANFDIIGLFRPNLVVIPQSRAFITGKWMLDIAKKINCLVVSIPTEGVIANDDVGMLFGGKLSNLTDPVNINFLWGKGMENALKMAGSACLEKTIVVGNPRFDFYVAPLSSLFLSKTDFCNKYKMDVARPIVLWATGYPYTHRDRNEIVKDLKTTYTDKLIDVDTFIEDINMSQKLTLEAFIRFASANKNINFIIKPHPFERIDENNIYLKCIQKEGVDNVFIINEEHISNVLNSADLLLHTRSTTSTEAWFLKKPTISLEFVPTELGEHHKSLIAGGDIATNYEELESKALHYLHGGEIPESMMEAREKYIFKWFYKIDGKSTQRIANVLNEFLQTHHNDPKSTPFNLFLRYYLRNLLKYVRDIKHNVYLHLASGDRLRKIKMDENFKVKRTITPKDVEKLENSIKSIMHKSR